MLGKALKVESLVKKELKVESSHDSS